MYRPVLGVPLSVPATSSAGGNGSDGRWPELLAFPLPTSGGIAQSLALLNATAKFYASTKDPLLHRKAHTCTGVLLTVVKVPLMSTKVMRATVVEYRSSNGEALRQLARAQDPAFADRNAYVGDADWDNTMASNTHGCGCWCNRRRFWQ